MATAQLDTLLRHIHQLAAAPRIPNASDRQLVDDFACRRDEAAFTALVARHGPMVLRTCRRVLHHEQDAEDAFQATFLILAKNSVTIRRREALAGWLHGVAYRTAMKVKRSAARRRNQEARLRAMRCQRTQGPLWSDVQAALDEEIEGLPEHHRTAFVLCVLEGKSVPEAASVLTCKVGTVSSWLARARKRLQQRLARRGIELGALLAALSLMDGAAKATPALLARETIRFGLLAAAGGPAAGLIPPHLATLAQGVTGAMTKAKIATVVLLTVSLITAGVLTRQAFAAKERPAEIQKSEPSASKSDAKQSAAPAKPQAADVKDEKSDAIEINGRIVDPDGQPVPGAKVFFARSMLARRDEPPPAPPTVTSDAEGRFRLSVSRSGYRAHDEYEREHWLQGAVVAVGKGHGPGFVRAENAEKLGNVTVKLVKDVPIEGRVVDLQGKPIAGARVQVRSFAGDDGPDLKPFVESLQKKGTSSYRAVRTWLDPKLLGLARPVVTDADGKFRLTGIGGERLVALRFEGPTIETSEVYAMTRPAPTLVVPRSKDHPRLGNSVFHGNTFDHAAAPTRPVVGVLRDRDTGKPLAGVTIQSRMGSAREHFASDPYVATTTDSEGQYRLVGLSREGEHRMQFLPGKDQPYLPATKTLKATTGLDPITVDFALKRGVFIRGRVTDKVTGRLVPALVRYGAFSDNSHLREAAGFRGTDSDQTRTAKDGSFTLVSLPGRGLLAVKAADHQDGRYLMAVGADEIKGPRWGGDHFDTEPSALRPAEFNTLVEINPAKDAETIVRDVVLDPGKTVTGTIVGPDGKPVQGVDVDHVGGVWFHEMDLPTADFRIPGIDPKHPRWFFFRHRGRNLGAVVLIKGDEPQPLAVRLQKCGTITGRLVDEDGQPRSGWIMGAVNPGQMNVKEGELGTSLFHQGTGKDGKFRIECVFPGLKFSVHTGTNPSYFNPVIPELSLKEGEEKDVGDLKVKPVE
jgi:RNA polymerase sigma factor (sigma-70 family)